MKTPSNMLTVSRSKFVSLISYRFVGLVIENSDIALKNVSAHKAFGKPNMPDEIAGIDTELQPRLSAVFRVLRTALWSRSMFSWTLVVSLHTGPTVCITCLAQSEPADVTAHSPVGT